METLIVAFFILSIFLILLGALLSQEEREITIDVTRGGNGTSHRHHTYEQEK